MLFTKCIAEHKATDIITYRLMAHMDYKRPHSYSIWKVNVMDDHADKICRGIKSKIAINLIWGDILNGIQK